MKNLKKIFAIAMSVATVAMSTSAFADEIAAAYDAENKVVAFTEEDAAAILNGINPDDQMTVVVVPSNFGETDDAGKIYYINQDKASDFASVITAMGVKDGFETADLGDATWQVRIGGENITATPYAVKFEDGGEKITIVYGDVTADNAADAQDASAILAKLIGGPAKVNDQAYEIGSTVGAIVYGDVTADNAADAQDASAILAKLIGGPAKVNDQAYEIGSNVELIIK